MKIEPKQIGLLLAPTYRSRAIVQMLEYARLPVGGAIILPGPEPVWNGPERMEIKLHRLPGLLPFRPGEDLHTTLQRTKTSFVTAPVADVNTSDFIKFLQPTAQTIYLFSGIGGCILQSGILKDSGKRFIHAHGGDAPRYSGSTAFYYSLLERGDIGATVFWMEEGLDTGRVLEKLIAKPQQGLEIDRIQDPLIRAEALALTVQKLCKEWSEGAPQAHEGRVTYHIIHPVLKHFALSKYNLGKS